MTLIVISEVHLHDVQYMFVNYVFLSVSSFLYMIEKKYIQLHKHILILSYTASCAVCICTALYVRHMNTVYMGMIGPQTTRHHMQWVKQVITQIVTGLWEIFTHFNHLKEVKHIVSYLHLKKNDVLSINFEFF